MIRTLALGVFFIGLILVGGSFYFATQYPRVTSLMLNESDHQLTEDDQVLVTSDMLLLAHIDQRLLNEVSPELASTLGDYWGNAKIIDSEAISGLLPGIDQLVDGVTFSLYQAEKSVEAMAILHGRFDSASLLQVIESSYQPSARSIEGKTVYDIVSKVGQECGLANPWTLYLEDGRAYIGDTELINRMLPLLFTAQHAGMSLQEWQSFSRNKAVSVWVKQPTVTIPSEYASSRFSDFINIQKRYLSEFANTFIGLGYEPWSRETAFVFQGEAKNDKFASFALAKWKAYMNQKSQALSQDFPLLYELVTAMPVATKQAMAIGESTFVVDALPQLATAFNNAENFLLSNADIDQVAMDSAILEEIIAVSPKRYFANYKAVGLSPYREEKYGRAHAVSGPMGILLEYARLDSQDEALSLGIKAIGQVANLGELTGRARFMLTGIIDRVGNNVAKSELCNKKGNHGYLAMHANADNVLTVEHGAQLGDNVQLQDLKYVNAKVEIDLPAKVKRQRMALPDGYPATVALSEDAQLTLLGLQGSYLRYEVAGQVKDLLEIRALNKQKKVLQHSAFLQKAFYSEEGDIDRLVAYNEFHGEPAGFEIVVAEGSERESYDLSINLSKLAVKGNRHNKITEPKLTLPADKDFDAIQVACSDGMVKAGPVCFDVNDDKLNLFSFAGDKLHQLLLRSSLRLTSINGREASINTWPEFSPANIKGWWHSEIKLPINGEKVATSLKGEIEFAQPSAVTTLTFDKMRLGNMVQDDMFEARLVATDMQGQYEFLIEEGLNRILMLVGRDESWQPVEASLLKVKTVGGNQGRVTVEAPGATSLVIYLASEQKMKRYGFELTN